MHYVSCKSAIFDLYYLTHVCYSSWIITYCPCGTFVKQFRGLYLPLIVISQENFYVWFIDIHSIV